MHTYNTDIWWVFLLHRGVEEILKHFPGQINIKNRAYKTPLYFAALNGHADVVTYLLSQQV